MTKTVVCLDCRSEFSYEYRRGRPRLRCDTCTPVRERQRMAAAAKRWRDADPERRRAVNHRHDQKRKNAPGWREYRLAMDLQRTYGLSMRDFETLLAEQGGVCAICEGPPSGPGRRFHVDHCHETARVRGLLCGRCNTAIGLLGDDPARVARAVEYLRR